MVRQVKPVKHCFLLTARPVTVNEVDMASPMICPLRRCMSLKYSGDDAVDARGCVTTFASFRRQESHFDFDCHQQLHFAT